MNGQTNRRRCLVLLAAPLLASSVALTPALAAHGSTATEPGAAPVAPSCQLLPGGNRGPAGGASYKLHLGGFPANQAVRIEGPKTSLQVKVNAKGVLDRPGLSHGAYGVSYKVAGSQQTKRVTCATAPAQKPGGGKQDVRVTKVEVVILTPAGTVIDCAKPTTAEFDGKITATGTGKVRYYWTFASSSTPVSPGSVDFAPPITGHALLHVVEVPPQPNASTVSTFVTLHLPDQKQSARSGQVTFTCEKK
ncbi:hypothetical protein NJL88_03405 [Streptomyces sp. DK15]|uniref:hypothetical protein n=1 Tax=Streptomyces sp. DK15 TaxID=2957499 RepID=UPI0029A72FB1|nr:hypothetical protein [Streptomyces sp. DK15]MDX2389149.1 hypothetical protein [Streptomyces sp. DK15]